MGISTSDFFPTFFSREKSGMFANFRLPSEDEWEYAAYACKSTDPEDKTRVYPWNDYTVGKRE